MNYLRRKLTAVIASLNTWVLKAQNLYTLTSNTAPSPFIASLLTSVTSGTAYNVFDNNSGTAIVANYFSPSDYGLGAQILFGRSLRLSKFIVRGLRSGQTNWKCTIVGIKEDDTTQVIHSANVSVSVNVTIDSLDKETAFKGIKVYIDTRGDLICTLYSCQVSEYYERG